MKKASKNGKMNKVIKMSEILELNELEKVASLIKSGKVVCFPTDTVYGVGVIYDNQEAIKNMKIAKGRDENKPFPMMVCDYEQISEVAIVDENIKKIVHKFTPGALTLVMRKNDSVKQYVTNGKDTIAIRIPDNKFILDLLKLVGKPMLVTSANLSDYPSCNNINEVLKQLDNRVDAIVNGECGTGVASTIIDVTDNKIKLLRMGTISLDEIEKEINL